MAQISIVDSGSDIIVTESGISQSYPKQTVRTRKDAANTLLLLLHGERPIKIIKNKADVTNITSTNLADLQTKIINVLDTTPPVSEGGTGGITTETDPTVPVHVKSISQENITAWNGTAATAHTHANKAALDAITGVNTGDQDLSVLVPKNNASLTGLTTVQTLKITGGTPGVGKILTSDADGDATWVAPAAGATIDAVPTDGSTNAVSSNGTFDALALKAPLDSPNFTGPVTLPTTTNIGSVTGEELANLDGVTAPLQGQIDSKAPLDSPNITGVAVLPATTSIGSVSAAEIAHLDGVTSPIQTQLGSKLNSTTAAATYQTLANLSADLTPSATKYPSVDAVNNALSGKASATDFANYVDLTTDQANIAGVKSFTTNLRATTTATIANTATFNVFNTANETTASEALRMYWTGNVAYIQTVQTGATLRALTIGVNTAANININNTGGASGYFTFSRNTNVVGTLVNIGKSSTFTHSSGVTSVLGVLNTINQTGTAGYNGIYVSIFEQAVGTGAKNLLDLGTNTADNNGGTHTSKFSVSNTGAMNTVDTAVFKATWANYQASFGSTAQAGRIGFARASDGAISTRMGYTSATENSAFDISNTSGGGSFNVTMNAGTSLKVLFNGNTIIQTGGTFTDSGDKFQVTGTSRLSGKVTVVASDLEFTTTATGAILIDRSTGLKRRIIVSNGVINTEAVA